MRQFGLKLLATLVLWAGGVVLAAPLDGGPLSGAPEQASGFSPKAVITAQHAMIVTANPLASAAGYAMLQQGGSAVDAAIAAQLVLNLVEPQSSGIGGGGFMLVWDNRHQRLSALDGRETAPLAADENLFTGPEGKPLPFFRALIGGRSVGTPGLVRMMELAHRQSGKLPWQALFQPAIKLAREGFAVSPRLHALIAEDRFLANDPAARQYFFGANAQPRPVGFVLRNPEFADTLQQIAEHGATAFYSGPIAHDVVAKVRTHASNPGKLSEADLAAYVAKNREPVCAPYLRWLVCGMPPPSSGGVAVAQILGILEHTGIAAYPPHTVPGGASAVPDVEGIHLYTEAARLAYADRDRYLADPDFVPLVNQALPGLLDPDYLAARARLIGNRSLGEAPAGNPPGMNLAALPGKDQSPELPSTSHLSVVDAEGNAVSSTVSVEFGFGSHQMVRGFMLNNQLTDFSFVAQAADEHGVMQPVVNRVQPGKRPRSAMSPTLVFARIGNESRPVGPLVMALGSPGGSAIINYVGVTLVAALAWNMSLQDAISLPHFGSRNGPTELESGILDSTDQAALVAALQARGHEVWQTDMNSGLHGFMRASVNHHDVWVSGTDPRREGLALGQ